MMTTRLLVAAMMAAGFSVAPVSAQSATQAAVARSTAAPEQLLVTVPRHRSQADTALPVTVLTGDELRNRAASTLGETLNNKPGLASASFGPSVGQPVIRGQQGARVAVLQNGTRSADAATVSVDHAVAVEPVLAETLEVLRGPATLLYGGGAIGGVVNVIDQRIPTQLPTAVTGAAELRHGSVMDETTTVVKVLGSVENLALYVDALHRDTNNIDIPGFAQQDIDADELDEATSGYIANTDSQTESLTLGTSFIMDKGYIGIAVSHLDNEYGIPAGSHEHHDHGEELDHDDHEEELDHAEEAEETVRLDMEQTRYDLRGEWRELSTAVETLRWSLTYTDYEHVELEGAEVGTEWTRDSWESRLELLHTAWYGWQGAIGLQWQDSALEAVGDESYLPRVESQQWGVFVVESLQRDAWLYEVGARIDRSNVDPDSVIGTDSEAFTSVSVSASALWQITDTWRLGVAVSQSERAPVAEELYSNDGNTFPAYEVHVATASIEVGDPGLDTERANNIDLSFSYASGPVEGFLTLFYNDFSDYIYLQDTALLQDETPVLNYMQEDATFQGVEFEVSYDLGTALGVNWELKLFGDWLDGELDTAGDVPRLPPQRLGSTLSLERGPLSAYVTVLEADAQDKPGFNQEKTAGYTRWDAGINYRLPLESNMQLITFLRLKNIDDAEIRNSASFLRELAPEAGRSAELGFRLNF